MKMLTTNKMTRREMIRASCRGSVIAAALGIIGAPSRAQALSAWQAGTIVNAARSKLGLPYQENATNIAVGTDCSLLTQWSYQRAGISIPRNSRDQYAACRLCVSPLWYRGALLFFRDTDSRFPPGTITHVAISCGDGVSMVSANSVPTPGKVVLVSWWNNSYWRPRFVTAAVPW